MPDLTGLSGVSLPVRIKTGSTVSSTGKEMLLSMGLGQLVMIGISLVLIYLAIAKGFEPLLLIPIGFGGLLSNAPRRTGASVRCFPTIWRITNLSPFW